MPDPDPLRSSATWPMPTPMERTLRAIGVLAVASWLLYALYAASVLAKLAKFRMLRGDDIPSLAIPLAGLCVALWLGFSRRARPSIHLRVVAETLLLVMGWLFLTVLMASRTG